MLHDGCLVFELGEYLFGGDILPRFGLFRFLINLQFTEEDVANLFRTGNIKGFTCFFINGLFLAYDALLELA